MSAIQIWCFLWVLSWIAVGIWAKRKDFVIIGSALLVVLVAGMVLSGKHI